MSKQDMQVRSQVARANRDLNVFVTGVAGAWHIGSRIGWMCMQQLRTPICSSNEQYGQLAMLTSLDDSTTSHCKPAQLGTWCVSHPIWFGSLRGSFVSYVTCLYSICSKML